MKEILKDKETMIVFHFTDEPMIYYGFRATLRDIPFRDMVDVEDEEGVETIPFPADEMDIIDSGERIDVVFKKHGLIYGRIGR